VTSQFTKGAKFIGVVRLVLEEWRSARNSFPTLVILQLAKGAKSIGVVRFVLLE
jgi:hypothetical protein